MDIFQPRDQGCHRAWPRPGKNISTQFLTEVPEHTWKFFSPQPFFAKARTITSASSLSISPSIHKASSSSAANLVFQFASARSAVTEDGNNPAARASASSGVCLYLKLSRAPGAWDGEDLEVLEEAGCDGFLAVVLPTAGGFLAYPGIGQYISKSRTC
jgi:hypothetical protein